MTASEILKERVNSLPEPVAREVLDFLVRVSERHNMDARTRSSKSMRGRLAHYADSMQHSLESEAWAKVSVKKHASD